MSADGQAGQRSWQALEASTNDNGAKSHVTGRVEGEMFRVDGPSGLLLVPPDSYPTNYWSKGLVSARTAINNQLGEAVALTAVEMPAETLTVRGKPTQTRRYHLLGRGIDDKGVIAKDPYLDIYLWYDQQDIFAGLAFNYRGFEFRYVRE